MPSFEKLAKEEETYQTTGELFALKWMDKREVHMQTRAHEPVIVETEKSDRETGRKIKKPLCIAQYNKNTKAVDQVDMRNSFSECLRKTIKSHKRLFYLFIQYHCAELIEEYGLKRSSMRGRPLTDCPLSLTARHPGVIVRKRCFVCSQTVKREKNEVIHDFLCTDCYVTLCNLTYSREYYTLKTF